MQCLSPYGRRRWAARVDGVRYHFLLICNLKCVFCQNHELSWRGQGSLHDAGELARLMISLQEQGCHNINFVTPEHVVPQIMEALPLAIEMGLHPDGLQYKCL
jgi:uncharacterized Fe-S radical SAM superfamily protein PflX